MYLRHTTRRKDGKVHRYWRLVRSVRVGRKVVQQTVAQLGELDAQGRARARALARAIMGDHEQPDLFDPAEPDATDPGSARAGFAWTVAGPSGMCGWAGRCGGRCGSMRCWSGCCPTGGKTVPWSTMAAVLVLARLCEPSSELHIAEDWYRRTALEDLLALPAPLVNDDRLYRALDACCPTRPRWSSISWPRLGSCSRSTTTCCSTT